MVEEEVAVDDDPERVPELAAGSAAWKYLDTRRMASLSRIIISVCFTFLALSEPPPALSPGECDLVIMFTGNLI